MPIATDKSIQSKMVLHGTYGDRLLTTGNVERGGVIEHLAGTPVDSI